MPYKQRTAGKYAVIEWTGDVDLSCTSEARSQVLECLESGQDLLVDLTAVHHIDSSAVAVLIEGLQTAKETGLDFGLIGPPRAVLAVLELAHLDQIIPIHASIEALVKPGR